ncbi:hypothetical protein [Nonomuraea sp. NPDC003201]
MIERVQRTGLAVVHEQELIIPAPGSAAQIVAAEDATEIRYVFPVEIEVRGGQEPVDADAIAEHTLRRLTQGLRSL